MTYHTEQIKATTNLAQNFDPVQKVLALKCVTSSRLHGNHLLSLKKTIGKSLYVLFPFCMFKGLLLHIWHLHIYGKERIAFISLTLSYELMYLVALLAIAEIEKNFYHLRGVSTMPTNNVGIILLNGFCLVNYFLYI